MSRSAGWVIVVSLWLCFGTNPATAQQIVVVSVARQAPAVAAPEPMFIGQPLDVAEIPPPNLLNRTGLACYTNQNSPGCSNLRRDLLFIFGSCRSFFGEPCLPHPNSTGVGVLGFRSGSFGAHILGGSSFGSSR